MSYTCLGIVVITIDVTTNSHHQLYQREVTCGF